MSDYPSLARRSNFCVLPTLCLVFDAFQSIGLIETLGGLLGGRRPIDIFSNISGIVEGSRTALHTFPDLFRCRRSRLSTNECIDPCLQMPELTLDEAALSESSAEEGRIDSNQNPGPLAESQSRKEKAAPEKNFKDGNETHGCIIVFLNKLANGVSHGAVLICWLCSRGCPSCGSNLLGWLQSWDQVCAGICCDMEDRVDAEREHCERVLWCDEPDKCHDFTLLARCCTQGLHERTNASIGHSHQLQ